MRETAFLIAAVFALASCAHDDAGAGDDADGLSAGPINGEAAYLEHCAVCHETGMLGAPREGEPQDWQARSSLWQAVLMEHAKTGYFVDGTRQDRLFRHAGARRQNGIAG
jgi:cytochrome c5